MIQLLLDYGAEVNAAAKNGYTPLDLNEDGYADVDSTIGNICAISTLPKYEYSALRNMDTRSMAYKKSVIRNKN